jgi:hypothetical protein
MNRLQYIGGDQILPESHSKQVAVHYFFKTLQMPVAARK